MNQEMSPNKQDSKIELLSFIAVSLLVLSYRIWILQIFGFVYTDSDQSIMWLGAKNYANGLFHEPRFYGQAYNTMLEAFLSVPLIKLGIPIFKSLPIITTILALLPIFILSIVTYLRNSKITSVIILSIFLTLPIEYSFITSMPRGFVTGIAFSSFSFLFLYKYDSKYAFFFVFFIAVLAYSINANSIILSIPICCIFFFKNYLNKYYYIYSILGLILGFSIHYIIDTFYIIHPYYNLHSYQTKFSFDLLKIGVSHLDIYFNYIVPIFWKNGWLIIVSFIPLAITLYKKNKYEISIVSFIIPFMILGTLLITKVHDGSDSVFFSYARMYLAVPIVLLLMLSFLTINNRKWMYFTLIVSVIFTSINLTTSKQVIDFNLKKNHVITILKNELAFKECSKLFTISKKENIELIVISNHWLYDVYNYGCPACIEQFPNTLRPSYERRTWRLIEEENRIYSTILVIDLNRKFDNEFNFVTKLNDTQGYYLIKNNQLSTILLLNKLSIDVRKFK